MTKYHLNIAHNGQFFARVELPDWMTQADAESRAQNFKVRFPVKEGYEVSLQSTRVESHYIKF